MEKILCIAVLLITFAAIVKAQTDNSFLQTENNTIVLQKRVPHVSSAIPNMPDSLDAVHPHILNPDFYHKHQQQNKQVMPTIPVDPYVDHNMPRVFPKSNVDPIIKHVYPHIGRGLLERKSLFELHKQLKPKVE